VTGSQKSKMAALNWNYLYLSFQTIYQRRSNGYPPIFGVQQPNGTLANSARCNRKSVLKMAASKPEVLISQLPDKISTPIQRLTSIFGVLGINGTNVYC